MVVTVVGTPLPIAVTTTNAQRTEPTHIVSLLLSGVVGTHMRAAQISGEVAPTRWLLKAEMPRVIRFKS